MSYADIVGTRSGSCFVLLMIGQMCKGPGVFIIVRVSKPRVLSKRLILIILQYNFKLSHGVRLCDGYVMSVGGSLQHLHEQLSSLKTEIVQSGDRPQLSELLDTVVRATIVTSAPRWY